MTKPFNYSVLTLLLLFSFSITVQAQTTDTLQRSPSLQVTKNSNSNKDTLASVGWSDYFRLLGTDIKTEITAPFHWKGKSWATFGALAVAGGLISFADKPVQQHMFTVITDHPKVQDLSNKVSGFGSYYEGGVLVALGLTSLATNNEKLKTTTLLATQACITGGLTESLIKIVAGRQTPPYTQNTLYTLTPRFNGPAYKGKDDKGGSLNSSFPSGHTTIAFAAATVFAMQYRNIPAVPILAYGAAALVGASRVTGNDHWTSDVFAGAVLGYFTGRLAVHNYYRQPLKKKNGQLSFHLNYQFGKLLPGAVYTFR